MQMPSTTEKATVEAGKDTMTIGVAVVIVTASAMEIAIAIVTSNAMGKATAMEKTAMGIAIDTVKADILEVGAAAIVAMETPEIMETAGTTMTGTTMKTEILKIGIMRARKKATETTARQMVLQFLNPPSARKAGGIVKHCASPQMARCFSLRKVSVPEVAIWKDKNGQYHFLRKPDSVHPILTTSS